MFGLLPETCQDVKRVLERHLGKGGVLRESRYRELDRLKVQVVRRSLDGLQIGAQRRRGPGRIRLHHPSDPRLIVAELEISGHVKDRSDALGEERGRLFGIDSW